MIEFDSLKYDKKNGKIIAKKTGSSDQTETLRTDKWLKVRVAKSGSISEVEFSFVTNAPTDVYIKVEEADSTLRFSEWSGGGQTFWAVEYIGITDDRPGMTGVILKLETTTGIYLKKYPAQGSFTHFEIAIEKY